MAKMCIDCKEFDDCVLNPCVDDEPCADFKDEETDPSETGNNNNYLNNGKE